jgi:hypothetical protein
VLAIPLMVAARIQGADTDVTGVWATGALSGPIFAVDPNASEYTSGVPQPPATLPPDASRTPSLPAPRWRLLGASSPPVLDTGPAMGDIS